MRIRAGIVLIQNNKVALIERFRAGLHYFIFPGGGVDEGESPEQAAVREAMEELGIEVAIKQKVAEVHLGSKSRQLYFLVEQTGGEFGTGTGEEFTHAALDDDATFTVKVLTPETALKAAQAALKSCRDRGFQITVAVVDRMGVVQVLLRDRFAGPHTTDMATAKAYTAVSFRTNTTELAEMTQPGRPASGIRNRPGVAAVGGGLMIEAGGSLLGAIGVSGAPGAREDDACAAAGIAAIREDIEL